MLFNRDSIQTLLRLFHVRIFLSKRFTFYFQFFKALEELRSRASELSRTVDAIENFKASIGDEPAIIQDRISRLQKERDKLEDELANRAPQDTQKELDGLKRDYEELKYIRFESQLFWHLYLQFLFPQY